MAKTKEGRARLGTAQSKKWRFSTLTPHHQTKKKKKSFYCFCLKRKKLNMAMIQKIHVWNNERRNCREEQQQHFKSDHRTEVLDNAIHRLVESECWHTPSKRKNLKARLSTFDECEFAANAGCVWNNKTTRWQSTVQAALKSLQVWHHIISLQEDEKIGQMRASTAGSCGWGLGVVSHGARLSGDPEPVTQKSKTTFIKTFSA